MPLGPHQDPAGMAMVFLMKGTPPLLEAVGGKERTPHHSTLCLHLKACTPGFTHSLERNQLTAVVEISNSCFAILLSYVMAR